MISEAIANRYQKDSGKQGRTRHIATRLNHGRPDKACDERRLLADDGWVAVRPGWSIDHCGFDSVEAGGKQAIGAVQSRNIIPPLRQKTSIGRSAPDG